MPYRSGHDRKLMLIVLPKPLERPSLLPRLETWCSVCTLNHNVENADNDTSGSEHYLYNAPYFAS